MEELAIKVVTLYGTTADYYEIHDVLQQNGFQDPDGELAADIKRMVQTAVVRVKVRYV